MFTRRGFAVLVTLAVVAGAWGAPAVAGALTTTSSPQLTLNRLIRTSPFAGSSTTVRDNEALAYVAADDSLWMADDNADAIYEVNRTTGALKRTVTQSQFAASHVLGGTTTAGTSRNEDLEALAYDANADALYAFSGSTKSTPTVYRLTRSGGSLQIDSWRSLPSEWTGAGWRLADGKLYVGNNKNFATYDYATNTFGPTFTISGISKVYGIDFDDVSGDMLAVTSGQKLYRVDMASRSVRSGWNGIGLSGFGMLDTRAVEVVGEQLFVSDGYDYRSSSDPMNHAVFVYDVSGPGGSPSAPTASFTASPVSGTAPLAVSFTDTSTGGPTAWSWTFGDGGTSNAQSPSHTYTTGGTYTATLTASNANGSTSTSRTITVSTGGTGGVTATLDGDTYFNTSSPTKNYGNYAVMKLHSPSSAEYRPLVRFTVSGLSGAPSSVKLRLWVTDGSVDGGSWYLVSNAWDESTVNWNTKPAVGGSPVAVAGTVTTGTWVEIDVTSAVTGNGTYSFEATSASTNTAQFGTRDAGTAPQLVVVP